MDHVFRNGSTSDRFQIHKVISGPVPQALQVTRTCPIVPTMSHADDLKFDPSRTPNLDAPERREAIPPASIVCAVGPVPGMALADLGCGTGTFTWPVVEALKGEGTFYAVDSSEVMLGHLRERARAHPWGRAVVPVLSTDQAVPLPDGCLDTAVLGSVYHEIPDRPAYLLEVGRLLRPGGRVVIIDWRPLPEGAERTVGPPPHHRLPEETARREVEGAGYAARSLEVFELLWCLVGIKG
jgi:SAM-dependent methyltransferase